MPTASNIKTELMAYDMVTAEIFGWRNYKRDSDVLALETRIKEETGRLEDDLAYTFAYCVSYTENLNFNWTDEAPPEATNLEVFWGMVADGVSMSECYLFYIENVANWVTNSWQQALFNAHKIWKPTAERKPTDKEAEKDPNA
jgi:hypothetical protein